MSEKQRTYKISGDVDHHSFPALKRGMDELILKERPMKLIVDFKKALFMDSSGIGLLIGRYKSVQKYGGKMYAKNMNRQIKRAFRIAGLDKIIGEVKK